MSTKICVATTVSWTNSTVHRRGKVFARRRTDLSFRDGPRQVLFPLVALEPPPLLGLVARPRPVVLCEPGQSFLLPPFRQLPLMLLPPTRRLRVHLLAFVPQPPLPRTDHRRLTLLARPRLLLPVLTAPRPAGGPLLRRLLVLPLVAEVKGHVRDGLEAVGEELTAVGSGDDRVDDLEGVGLVLVGRVGELGEREGEGKGHVGLDGPAALGSDGVGRVAEL